MTIDVFGSCCKIDTRRFILLRLQMREKIFFINIYQILQVPYSRCCTFTFPIIWFHCSFLTSVPFVNFIRVGRNKSTGFKVLGRITIHYRIRLPEQDILFVIWLHIARFLLNPTFSWVKQSTPRFYDKLLLS